MKKNIMQLKSRGFIALMATIVISLVLMVMAVETGALGFHARFNVLGTEAKEQASSLAEGCADQALASLVTDPNFVGDTTITNSIGTCKIFPVDLSTPGLVKIKTQAEVRGSFANLNIAMNTADIHLGSVPLAPAKGTIVVIAHVVNDGTGTKTAGNFTMSMSGTNPSQTSFSGSESGVAVTVDPGSYSADGIELAGYQKSVSTNCSGTVIAGDLKFCTIVFDDVTTTLTVIANVKNDNAGTKLPADVPFFIDGVSVTLGERKIVTVGNHTVSASAMTGYAVSTWGYQCDIDGKINVTLGQNKTCIINYDDLPPPTPSCADTVMMLDRSYSMFGNSAWIPDEKTAAKSLVDLYSTVTPAPKMSFGQFGDVATGRSAEIITQLTAGYSAIKTAIDNGLQASGHSIPISYTNLADAISEGSSELNSSRHDVSKEKVLILISDGVPTLPTGTTNGSVTLTPSAIGTLDAWSANIGTKTSAVDEAVSDDDVTYIYPATAIPAETYLLAGAGITDTTAVINSVTLNVFAKGPTGANIKLIAEDGTDIAYDGGRALTTSFANNNPWIMATNPLTGSAWTLAEVNNWTTKFGVLNNSTVGVTPTVTQIFATVNYTTTSSGSQQKAPTVALSGGSWTNPANALTSNSAYANSSTLGQTQVYGTFGSFGVTGTITGIKVSAEGKIVAPVSTTTSLLSPTSQGHYLTWQYDVTAIDETTTPDCNNSSGNRQVIIGSHDGDRESDVIDIASIPDGSTITGVTVYSYDKRSSSSGDYKTFIRVGNTDTDATSNLTASNTNGSACSSAKTQSFNGLNINKTSGTTLEIGVMKVGNTSVYVGALRATVTYTKPLGTGSLDIFLSSNGTTWTTPAKSISFGTTESTLNTTNDLWGRAWTSANVDSLSLRVQNNYTTDTTVSLDQVMATVSYTTTNTANTSQLLPVSVGNYTAWTPTGGTAVNVVQANDTTTYIGNTMASSNTSQSFLFPNSAIPSGATITSVVLHATAKEMSGTTGNIKLIAEKGSTPATDSGNALTSSYFDYYWTMTTNPLGGSWTLAEVNNWTTKFGVQNNSTGGTIPRVTKMYLVVNYYVNASPTEAALMSADTAKLAGVNLFTIHFGDTAGQDFLANLASGSFAVTGHQSGSRSDGTGGGMVDTGFVSPSAQSADTGNGFETNPTNAFADGGGSAQDINNASTGEKHRYYGYAITVPPGAVINGIETRADWWLDSNSGTNSFGIQLSWDGGTNWTTVKTITDEPTNTSNSDILGGSTDNWGHVWTNDNFSSTNFRVRAVMTSSSNSRDFYLDWLPVRVYYTVANTENSDGDNFFVAPTSADMHGIFDYIGEQVCPALGFAGAVTPPTTGTILVMTSVINNNPSPDTGTATPASFQVSVSATNPSQTSFAGSASAVAITVDPGTYSITQSCNDLVKCDSGLYSEMSGASCSSRDFDGTQKPIEAGEVRVCVFTNDDTPPPPPPPNLNVTTGSWLEVP